MNIAQVNWVLSRIPQGNDGKNINVFLVGGTVLSGYVWEPGFGITRVDLAFANTLGELGLLRIDDVVDMTTQYVAYDAIIAIEGAGVSDAEA